MDRATKQYVSRWLMLGVGAGRREVGRKMVVWTRYKIWDWWDVVGTRHSVAEGGEVTDKESYIRFRINPANWRGRGRIDYVRWFGLYVPRLSAERTYTLLGWQNRQGEHVYHVLDVIIDEETGERWSARGAEKEEEDGQEDRPQG